MIYNIGGNAFAALFSFPQRFTANHILKNIIKLDERR